MPANLVGLEVALGLNDKEPTRWDGDIRVSEGRVMGLEVVRGDPQAKAEGNRFTARSRRMMVQQRPVIAGPELRINLDAPLSATVTVTTEQGTFTFTLSDLATGTVKTFLTG
jgi:hypothetical protein